MSVIVKGMMKPKKGCEGCPLYDWDDLRCGIRESYKESFECPVVRLPDVHGRLIDIDMLIQKMDTVEDAFHVMEIDYDPSRLLRLLIDKAPVIFEAEI